MYRARASLAIRTAVIATALLVVGCGSPGPATPAPSATPATSVLAPPSTASPVGSGSGLPSATPLAAPSGAATPTPPAEPASVSDAVASRTWLGPLADDPFPGAEAQPMAVEDIAWTSSGWIAVGWDLLGAIAWRSTDGATWTATDRQPSLDLARMQAVASAGGLVVAGGQDGSGRAAAWWSDDGGATWTRARDTPDMRTSGRGATQAHGYYGVTIESIAALASGGFIAVGSLSCDCQAGGFAAWRSTDGRSWRRLRRSAAPEAGDGSVVIALENGWLAGGGAIRMAAGAGWTTTRGSASAIAAGHGLVVRATVQAQSWDPPATVYWSRNGKRWTRGQLAGDRPWIVDMAATPDGFVAVGTLGHQPPGRVWTTGNGRRWAETEIPLLSGDPTAVAAGGDRMAITMNVDVGDGDTRPAVVVVPGDQEPPPTLAAPTRSPRKALPVVSASGLQLNGPVERPATALRPDGTILIAGGIRAAQGGNRAGSRGTLLLDPIAGTVHDGPRLPIRVAGASAATAPDGRSWVLGSTGHSRGATGWVLDAAAASWSAAPSSLRNLPALSLDWESDARLVLTDGGNGDQVLTTYDPMAGTATSELIPFAGPGVAVAASNVATYLVTQMRVWSRPAGTVGWVPGPPLPYPSASTSTTMRAAVLADGRLAVEVDDVLGPACTSDALFSVIEVLDPGTGTWASAALPQPRLGETVVALTDGRLAVIGGFRRTLDDCEWSGEQDLSADVLLVSPPG